MSHHSRTGCLVGWTACHVVLDALGLGLAWGAFGHMPALHTALMYYLTVTATQHPLCATAILSDMVVNRRLDILSSPVGDL